MHDVPGVQISQRRYNLPSNGSQLLFARNLFIGKCLQVLLQAAALTELYQDVKFLLASPATILPEEAFVLHDAWVLERAANLELLEHFAELAQGQFWILENLDEFVDTDFFFVFEC
jgi:hypothetical protein